MTALAKNALVRQPLSMKTTIAAVAIDRRFHPQ
jgi:hypothetical protein